MRAFHKLIRDMKEIIHFVGLGNIHSKLFARNTIQSLYNATENQGNAITPLSLGDLSRDKISDCKAFKITKLRYYDEIIITIDSHTSKRTNGQFIKYTQYQPIST